MIDRWLADAVVAHCPEGGVAVTLASRWPSHVEQTARVTRALVDSLDAAKARQLADVAVHLSSAEAVRELVSDAVDGVG